MVPTTSCVLNNDGPNITWFKLHKCAKGNVHINITLLKIVLYAWHEFHTPFLIYDFAQHPFHLVKHENSNAKTLAP